MRGEIHVHAVYKLLCRLYFMGRMYLPVYADHLSIQFIINVTVMQKTNRNISW